MKSTLIIGIVLIILGVAGLAYGGFSFTQKEKVIDAGPLQVSADKEKSVPIPPILSYAVLAGGIVLTIVGVTKKS